MLIRHVVNGIVGYEILKSSLVCQKSKVMIKWRTISKKGLIYLDVLCI